MGLSDFIKTMKKIFTGDDSEIDDDYRFRDLDDDGVLSKDDDENDNDDVNFDGDDNDVIISERLQKKYEKALEKFYSSLSEKAREDEDLSKMMDDIETKFWEGKIQDPAAAINKVYQKWKSSRPQRNQQKGNYRSISIDMLRRYDELTEEEKYSLTDCSSKFCLRNLKISDTDAVSKILQSWYDNKSLSDDKFDIIGEIYSSNVSWTPGDSDPYHDNITDAPLTQEEYQHRLVIFKNLGRCISCYDSDDYDKYAQYFQRYWLESGNHPEPIKCDDLIINRPCYLKFSVNLVKPHFHMGKRYFEKDSFQKVTLYLFDNAIEYLADGGHHIINLSDIIDLSLNNWLGIKFKWDTIDTKRVPVSEWPEPRMLEITCRNQKKILFSYEGKGGGSQAKIDLLVLRALVYYFIKKPHGHSQKSQINQQEENQQEIADQINSQQKTIQQEAVQKKEINRDSKIFFMPWVGSEYNSGGVYGKKVLVLGESHYGDAPDATDDTIGTIKEFVYDYWGAPYQQTFLCFERALAGREINQEEREQIWNSVIFYNYFQKSTTGPRTAPNMKAQKESEEAFRELLEQYQPDFIIVWGARLYQLLPAWDGTESKIKVGEDSTPVWHYKINGKKILAMSIHHPSSPSGKDWTYWHQFHKAFIGEPQFK